MCMSSVLGCAYGAFGYLRWYGIEPQALETASDCRQIDILGVDPSDPVKVRERFEDIVWEPEVNEHATKAVL